MAGQLNEKSVITHTNMGVLPNLFPHSATLTANLYIVLYISKSVAIRMTFPTEAGAASTGEPSIQPKPRPRYPGIIASQNSCLFARLRQRKMWIDLAHETATPRSAGCHS